MKNAPTSDRLDLRRLARFYRVFGRHYGAYLGLLAVAFGSLLLGVGVALLVPWPLAWMIDHVIRGEPLPTWLAQLHPWLWESPTRALGVLAASYVLIRVAYAVITFFDKYLMEVAGEYMVADIRERVFAHLQRLSLSFHGSAETGDLIFRMTKDMKDIRELLVKIPEALIRSVVTLFAFAGVMIWLNWKLALVALAAVPLLYALTRYTEARLQRAEKVKKKREGQIANLVAENVRALALVQAYGQQDAQRSAFDAENQASLAADVEATRLSRRFKRALDLSVAAVTAGVLYLGGQAVLEGVLTLGAFVVFYSYIDEVYGPIDKLAATILDLSRKQVAGDRILELIENDMVVRDRRNAVPAPAEAGRIEFQGVCFAYAGGREVLHDLSFAVEPGRRVALVGPSGAGKSTLISLLLRFFDPDRGSILLDGRDLRDYQLRSLRARVTILTQDAVMLRRSVRENIAFGREGASNGDVIAAARAARAHEFISALPQGYDTELAEGAVDLSGGQRQRISIARAMLREAPVLILDEPSTGLDAESEAGVAEGLARLAKGRTTFVIAHRFATIRDADLILVLDEGRLIAQGTHEALLTSSPRYREIYALQAERPAAA